MPQKLSLMSSQSRQMYSHLSLSLPPSLPPSPTHLDNGRSILEDAVVDGLEGEGVSGESGLSGRDILPVEGDEGEQEAVEEPQP